MHHDGQGIFAGLPEEIEASRFCSLAAVDVPDELLVTARTEDGEVMAVRHRACRIEGVQFHPGVDIDGDRQHDGAELPALDLEGAVARDLALHEIQELAEDLPKARLRQRSAVRREQLVEKLAFAVGVDEGNAVLLLVALELGDERESSVDRSQDGAVQVEISSRSRWMRA